MTGIWRRPQCRRWLDIDCEAPEKAGRPISQWTNREIADAPFTATTIAVSGRT
jgi:hypothetical protein